MHRAPSNFLVPRFHDLASKDLGLWDLGIKNGSIPEIMGQRVLVRIILVGRGEEGTVD